METPDPSKPASEPDRDLASLEDAERDLAELERALRRLDGIEESSDA
jgi:hypothetical protein